MSWNYVPPHCLDGFRKIDFTIPPPQHVPCESTVCELHYANDSSEQQMPVEENSTQQDLDMPSLVSMEILESQACPAVSDDDAVKRVIEMHQIVSDAEHYLSEPNSEDCNHHSTLDQWSERENQSVTLESIKSSKGIYIFLLKF